MYQPDLPLDKIRRIIPEDSRAAAEAFELKVSAVMMTIPLGQVQGDLARAYVLALWLLANRARSILTTSESNRNIAQEVGAFSINRLRKTDTHLLAFNLRDALVKLGEIPNGSDAHLSS